MTHWFGVRCVFAHGEHLFEERITLWEAESAEAAIELAEAEAREFADAVEADHLELAQSYGPLELAAPVSGAEVFSLMRESELDPTIYISSFFDTGSERQRSV